MINVGLTGGIATGKSLVSSFFKELGAYIIDYDTVSHEVITPKRNAWKRIVDQFGEEILNDDLTINRGKLGEIVFNDPKKRKKLEEIVHPDIAGCPYPAGEKRTKRLESMLMADNHHAGVAPKNRFSNPGLEI